MKFASQILRGHVMHARLEPARHVFRYPSVFFALDLDELPRRSGFWFGYNRLGVFTLRDRDHLEAGPGSIREKLARRLQREGIGGEIGRVEMITSARFLGRGFNPVSFYRVFDRCGVLKAVVAEVNNTFGERHVYVLPPEDRPSAEKVFHVSPFNTVEGEYRFRLIRSDGQVDIRVDLWRDGREIIKTRWDGCAAPMTTRQLARAAFQWPSSVLLTWPRIHWQAAKLFFLRRLRFHPSPSPPRSSDTLMTRKPSIVDRVAMRLVLPYLSDIRTGALVLQWPNGQGLRYGLPDASPEIAVRVRNWKFFRRILLDGDIGFGESYMAGEWETDDLPGLIALFLANRHVFESQAATAVLGRWLNRAFHTRRRNTRAGSRRNIREHYDLSNDLYRLFLDPTMMYSCAIYRDPNETLEEAQKNKLHALIRKAGIRPEHHVLEIGSGWGAFAIEAVRQTGCRVTTVTISEQQWQLARQRVREAGLEDSILVELRDYREIAGRYDRIISIEMIEAVGHEYLEEFFAVCDRALAPGGRVALQVITMPDERYEAYRRGVDWIQKHIFPGGHLPSIGALSEAMRARSSLAVEQIEEIGLHYARTLREWRANFLAARDRVRALGFDETFIRKWMYYFSYCEAAFAMRAVRNHHLVLSRRE